MKVKVNISIDDSLLLYIDDYANKNGISRSGAFSIVVSQYKQTMDGMETLQELIKKADEFHQLKGNS